jgi:hypothetical protein
MAGDAQVPYVDDIVVLAVKVVGDVGSNFADYARKVLEDPNTQRDLQKALYEIAREQHTVFAGQPSTDSAKAATAVATKAAEVIKGPLLEEIKKSASVKSLIDAVGKLGAGAKEKPLGVFLDNASTTIFLVAFGASLVGIATIYEIKTGTPITNAALSLLDNTQVKVKGFTLELGQLRVDYAKSQITLKTFVTKEWKALSVKIGLSGEVFTNGQKMQNANGSVQVVVPVVTGLNLTGKAEYDQNTAGGVGVGFQYNKDGLKIDVMADLKKIGMQYATQGATGPAVTGVDFNVKASAGTNFNMFGLPANVSAQAGLGNNAGAGGMAATAGVWLTITTDPVVKPKHQSRTP